MLSEVRMKLGGTLDRLRRDPGAARRFFLRFFGGATVLTGLATVILVLVALTSSESPADRLAWAGVVFGGATLLLAGIAAVVALLAYAVSTGLPDIWLSVRFPRSRNNMPLFQAVAKGDGRSLDTRDDANLSTWDDGQQRAVVLLSNKSGYPAKNPAVIVRLSGMSFYADTLQRPGTGDWSWIDYANPVSGFNPRRLMQNPRNN